MKHKLLEWNPTWNLSRFTDQQIVAIYNKERDKTVQMILENIQNPTRNKNTSYSEE
jgi:hypothetical protein